MNREDIEHMWKVASNNPNHDTNWHDPVVVAFAALVASAEREACAKVCEQRDDEGECPDQWDWHSSDYAAAIRARNNT